MNPRLPHDVLGEAREVTLTRGRTAVWDTGDDPTNSAPPLILLHGWNIDAPTNFGYAVPALSRNRRVVLFDHQGHGNGVRTSEPFTLDAAARDVVEILDALNIPRAIVGGYSMGGAIAQLVAHQSPDRCLGVVLMATSGQFSEIRRERSTFAVCNFGAHALRRMPTRARAGVFKQISAIGCRNYPDWIRVVVQTADAVNLLEAGAEIGRFGSSDWLGELTMPTAVIITAKDTVVPPRRQVDLATRVEAVHVETIVSDHDIPVRNDPRFATAIERAATALMGSIEMSFNGNDHDVRGAH